MQKRWQSRLAVLCGGLLSVASLMCGVEQVYGQQPAVDMPQLYGRQPAAKIVSVEGADIVYHLDQGQGKTATVRVPSQASADIKTKDPEGYVQTTIVSIDLETNRVKVRSDQGQHIVLEMSPEAVKQLEVNGIFVLKATR